MKKNYWIKDLSGKQALRDFGVVREGDLGEFVEKEKDTLELDNKNYYLFKSKRLCYYWLLHWFLTKDFLLKILDIEIVKI